MPSRFLLPFVLIATAALPLSAEIRPWKSADGLRTIQAEFIKRDAANVTLRAEGGKELVVELAELHPDDRKWLNLNHAVCSPVPNPAAVFDALTFDDTRDSTLVKLKASKIVEMTTDETFIGRSGLNGVFRTRQKIGALSVMLYFDWTDTGKLKEITLQTENVPAADYKSVIEPSWKEFVELLCALYGKPVHKSPITRPESVASGSFSPSHLWALDSGGSALLGTGRAEDQYQLVVRFTKTKIQPVEIP